MQNGQVALLNEKSVPTSDDFTNKVGLKAAFCELEAASFTCVAVVQGSNELNLLDKSLQLDFLNSAPFAASHWESAQTSNVFSKSQADESTHDGKYTDEYH